MTIEELGNGDARDGRGHLSTDMMWKLQTVCLNLCLKIVSCRKSSQIGRSCHTRRARRRQMQLR